MLLLYWAPHLLLVSVSMFEMNFIEVAAFGKTLLTLSGFDCAKKPRLDIQEKVGCCST